MSDTIAETSAPAEIAYNPPTFGDVSEIHEALGFDGIEDLAPDTRESKPEVTVDEVAAKRDTKTKDAKSEADTESAELRAIEARAKERRKARNASRAKTEPVATKPVETSPAKTVTLGPVEQAVKDTLEAIDRLARGDADSAAKNDGAVPDSASRDASMQALTAKIDELKEGLKQTVEGKAQIEAMQAQLKELNDDRIVRNHVAKAIERVADELPTLTDSKAIRAFNKEHGTDYTDAVEMVKEAAERYFGKFKVAPDMAELAKRIESKLKGDDAEQTETEKPTKKSKTVSRSDTSPPAARQGPDDRSYQQALDDFNSKFGLD
jgi:hypothetical protein